jgi:hypothetical protein
MLLCLPMKIFKTVDDVIYTQEEPLVVPRCLWDGMFSEGQRIVPLC